MRTYVFNADAVDSRFYRTFSLIALVLLSFCTKHWSVQDVDTLLSIIGLESNQAVAMSLLERHNGSIEAAVNAHFERPAIKQGVKSRIQSGDSARALSSKAQGASGNRTASAHAQTKSFKRSASGRAAGSSASKLQRQQKSIKCFFQVGSPAKSLDVADGSKATGSTAIDIDPVKLEQHHESHALDKIASAHSIEDAADSPIQSEPLQTGVEAAHGQAPACQDTTQLAKDHHAATDVQQHHSAVCRAELSQADAQVANSTVLAADGTGAVDGCSANRDQAINVTTTAAESSHAFQSLPLDKCDSPDFLDDSC